MVKKAYIDRVVDDLNALHLNFHGSDIIFDKDIVLSGIQEICSERERRVFFLSCDGRTLKEIGKDIGVSRERVRQIRKKVEKKLRCKLQLYYVIKQASEESRTYEYSLTDFDVKKKLFMDFAVNANLSTRSYNCLRRAGIETLEELVEYTPKKLIKSVRNLGKISLEEIEKALKEIGLSLKEE